MACNFPCNQAIVVGGGLAGMSAANTLLENGGCVVLLDKSSFCGGNSTKATSGINGSNTKAQRAHNIKDSAELFTQDTLKGGAKRPEVAKLMCDNSGPDVEWLMDKFNLDLSLVARLGGHSAPRTHRGKERFPGMTITYALIQMVEKVAERSDKARIITKARVHKLLTNSAKACIGCCYERSGAEFQEHGPVILASGGFGADFTKDSLLAMYRPDLMHLPTTNGEHCTGDGIKMGEQIGAKAVDLEWVQVHPTGLVKPDDPDAKIKFLAAEALRGVGGLVLDANGKRFANELGRRDYVTGEMWKNKPPFRLMLNKAASTEIIWHCKHYTGRGVMKYYANGKELAKDMGIDVQVLKDTHSQHYAAAKKTEKDPDGGPHPAYPSGKSWDDASGKTGSGKKFYHNIIDGPEVETQEFYVAIITPVIHYCMGGLEIDTDSAVCNAQGKAIPGLYAAGEVAGGVHGNNRLGGNSLLDCVVFGRVAGRAAAKYILGPDMKDTSLLELSGGGLTGEVKASKNAGGSYEDGMNDGSAGKKVATAASGGGGGGGGGFTMAEVAKHTTKEDCWVVVSDQVLNVTKFLSEHPGGELAILTFAGKDATEEFNMIHPPDVIGKYAPDAVIGMLGSGGGGGGGSAPAAQPALPPGMSYYTLDEVSKHTSKTDCWVVLDGTVLNVTSFLSQHPGGELAIMTFAGKDATEEFNMIHPPDVVGKYAADTIIGKIGGGAAEAVQDKQEMPVAVARKDLGENVANHHSWGTFQGNDRANWRIEGMDDNPGVLLVPVSAYISAAWVLLKTIIYEVCATIFSASNIKFVGQGTEGRIGLTRSAIFLIFFIVVHAVGNLHVFLGPDDFNGYGYFYVRLYWTGFGLPANIVEEYVLLSALLHVLVAVKRTWPKIGAKGTDYTLIATGTLLLAFMTTHLMQFRFGATVDYMVRPPSYLINFAGVTTLSLFWSFDPSVQAVPVRDIYKLEFDLFKTSPYHEAWSIIYVLAVFVFMIHAIWGWSNLLEKGNVLGVPKGHHRRVKILGNMIFIILGVIYISFVAYTNLTDPKGPSTDPKGAPQVCTEGFQCDFTNPHTNVWA
jgi:flavocytochrome c